MQNPFKLGILLLSLFFIFDIHMVSAAPPNAYTDETPQRFVWSKNPGI